MDMDILVLIELRIHSELALVRPYIAYSCLCRFLHHVAELSCKEYVSLAGKDRSFYDVVSAKFQK